MFSSYFTSSLFCSNYFISVGGGRIRGHNQSFSPSFYFSTRYEKDDRSLALYTMIGEKASVSLQGEREEKSSHVFGYRYGYSLSYYSEEVASLLLHGIATLTLGTEYVNSNIGLGIQGACTKYKYLDNLLFSLSPLFNFSLNLKADIFSYSFFMDFIMPYERMFKANATFGLEAAVLLSKKSSFSCLLWGRTAELLMDPWLSFQRIGLVFSITVVGE